MRRDWTTHVSGLRHGTLDRGMTLCEGQNDKAQHIQNFKCRDRKLMNAGGKLVIIKEERGLLERLIVISKKIDHIFI